MNNGGANPADRRYAFGTTPVLEGSSKMATMMAAKISSSEQ
jgi:hypothetical protein